MGFGQIVGLFAFLDFRKSQKVYVHYAPSVYKVSGILANYHTCIYSSHISNYFGVEPPCLEDYLTSKE